MRRNSCTYTASQHTIHVIYFDYYIGIYIFIFYKHNVKAKRYYQLCFIIDLNFKNVNQLCYIINL